MSELSPRYLQAVEARPEPDRTGRVKCISTHGYHEVAYTDWGDEHSANRIFCVHGLTRNSRDFDALALRLSKEARVICPDLPGRGKSDWLEDASDYHLLQYNMDATVLTAAVGYERFDWIGTSLGGLMGMALAGLKNSPIRRLIINDVGPAIPGPALRRIMSYAGLSDTFETMEEVEINLRNTLSSFGPMTDADWARLAVHSAARGERGLIMHHDPSIMQNFRRYAMFMHFSLWKYWDKISCPVLILRGEHSDFLPESLLERMIDRLPHADSIVFPGVGHTPTLNAPDQIDPVAEWLDRTAPQSRN